MSLNTHSSSKTYRPPTPLRTVNRLSMENRTNCRTSASSKTMIAGNQDRLNVLIESVKNSKNSSVQLLLQLYNRKRSLMELARRNEPKNQLYHCVQMELFQEQIFDSLSKIVSDMTLEKHQSKLPTSQCFNIENLVIAQKLSPIRPQTAKVILLRKNL
ncbi:unnamed protein product [Didymodactylos carnosus]|uniref:Uncharacterized protein n=1 Tax=Didymodactylos carnosus TaxID=1234261 RepID=A0A814G849_9BILA|nr:unnamed protein product [Didymodactylos carnosus]CAF0995088.1 unnamed protein product [Didymodactylos carnosus]CAF3656546.1 unnamed protein product [Didymodactylos carnosus]CAF3766782.1 unnamed protein product [Didymodactylos carnosus]